MNLRQIVAAIGSYLYGVEVGSPGWRNFGIVKIDARSGEVVARRNLDSGVWYISLGAVAAEVQGRFDLAATCATN
jgi:hypothetical protein